MNAHPRISRAQDRRLPAQQRVMTLHQLRSHGVSPAAVAARCRPGGPWQQLLPHVYLLHPGPPDGRERLLAALLYAGRAPHAHGPRGGGREAMVTGLAALALHRFSCVPPLPGLPRIDVLVPRRRRLRDAGEVSVHPTDRLPRPQEVSGLPCAPVPRALADAVADLTDPADAETVRRLLTEAVRGGHCDAAAVLHELAGAGQLHRPQVAAAVHALRGADRALAEQRLYAMVDTQQLPDPVWNVDLRLPGGPPLGAVDAYWPEHAVALLIDPRTGRPPGGADPYGWRYGDDEVWSRCVRQRERLEALGITLVHVTPAKLRDAVEQQAAVVRTALVAAADQLPAAYVVVTPH
jgi:hypothetical protein